METANFKLQILKNKILGTQKIKIQIYARKYLITHSTKTKKGKTKINQEEASPLLIKYRYYLIFITIYLDT